MLSPSHNPCSRLVKVLLSMYSSKDCYIYLLLVMSTSVEYLITDIESQMEGCIVMDI